MKNKYFGSKQRVFTLLLAIALGGHSFAQTAAKPALSLSAVETKISEGITVAAIKDATTKLSADDMEGRGTMQPGGVTAANWIADRFKQLGLKPLGDKGSYLQKIDFKETVVTPDASFKFGDVSLAHGTEFALLPQNNGNKDLSGDMVFIAYGIQADSPKRNDIEGVDLKGKIVVMLEGPPLNISKDAWKSSNASKVFTLSIMSKEPAAIVYIGHGREEQPPEESINYFGRRLITMPDEKGYPSYVPQVIYVSSEAAGKLFSSAGVELKEALKRAESNDFAPIKLNQKAKIVVKYKTTKGVSYNIAGYLEGSDPKLKEEAVLFSAHYDAFGMENGKIYHGAADNALGTAEMLAVAESYTKLTDKPKRSMIFLSVTGEEYGLYGSKYWAKNPTWNIKKVAANLNLDGIGSDVYGPVKTMVGYGAEHSSLGSILNDVAEIMQIDTIPDPFPEEKVFYRSDHYSFVERGVPSLMLMGAPAGDKEIWIKRIKDWEKGDYHQPGDVIQPDWAWEGAETVAEVMGIMGWRISEEDAVPAWLATSRFSKLERGNTKELPPEK